MTVLLLTLGALAVAPAIDAALRGRAAAEGFADGVLIVFVPGLLLLHVLPEAVHVVGWPAAVGMLGGLLIANLGERWHDDGGPSSASGPLAVVALLVHCVTDGVALALPDGHGAPLAWAVALHSLPVGLTTWRVSRRRASVRASVALLLACVVATAAGWLAAVPLRTFVPAEGIAFVQAVVAGALLHVVGHVGRGAPAPATGVGALVGLALAGAVSSIEPQGVAHLGASAVFLGTFLHVAPWLLAGHLGMAAAARVAPPGAAGPSGVIGRAAPAFLVAVALVGPLPAAVGALVAAGVWLAVGRGGAAPTHDPHARAALGALTGLGLAGLLQSVLPPSILAGPGWVGVAVVALVGGLVWLPPIAALPVAITLVDKGASAGAGAALVVAGLVPGVGTVSRSLRIFLGVAVGIVVFRFVPDEALDALPASFEAPGPIAAAAGAVLAALYAVGLVRVGVDGARAALRARQ